MASDAASHFGLPLQDPVAGEPERRDRSRSVSAELEAIFGEPRASGAVPGPGAVGRAPRRSLVSSPPRRLSPASLGGLIAAALAGIAAGSLLVKAPLPHRPTAAAPTLPHPDALPVELAQPTETPQASDAALAAPAPMEVAQAPAAAHAPALAPHAVARPRHASASFAQAQAADRRLRAAYAAAIRAGAPRWVLVDSRDRWSEARRREAHDPARLAASYNAIAADLNHANRLHARPAHRSLFHPRFASWWR